MAGARASIIHDNPLLADDAMTGMLEDMVLESKQKAYYEELKKATHGLQVQLPWQYMPRVKPEDLENEEDKERAIRLVSLIDEQMNENVEKKFLAELSAQKQKLSVKPEFEQKFEEIFAKIKYWSIVAEEVRKSVTDESCAMKDAPSTPQTEAKQEHDT